MTQTNLKNMIGLRFGRLTVTARAGSDKRGEARWVCQCDCGKNATVNGSHLRAGRVRSCGCYQREVASQNRPKRTKKKPNKDLTGQRFGRLVVQSVVEDVASSKVPTRWNCLCECGGVVIVRGYNLVSGGTRSCGCLQRENAVERFKTHGETRTRLHDIWCHMRHRCENPTDNAYVYYGGRGIAVCEEWHNFVTFRNWATNNGYRDDLTLDRVDVNGNYEPDNCRWITLREQQRNKRSNVRVTHNGETKTVCEWAEIFGCHPGAVYRTILDLEGRITR